MPRWEGHRPWQLRPPRRLGGRLDSRGRWPAGSRRASGRACLQANRHLCRHPRGRCRLPHAASPPLRSRRPGPWRRRRSWPNVCASRPLVWQRGWGVGGRSRSKGRAGPLVVSVCPGLLKTCAAAALFFGEAKIFLVATCRPQASHTYSWGLLGSASGYCKHQ